MLEIFLLSTMATMKVVLLCAGGVYLEKAQIFNQSIRKGVSEAFVKLLLPCLLFTRILPRMSFEMLPTMAWLALGNILYVSVGLVIGTIMVRLIRPAARLETVLRLAPAIGHGNSIPFMLVTLLCSVDAGFEEGDAEKAQGYVGVYLVMHSITLWGVGLSAIKKEKDDEDQPTCNSTREDRSRVNSTCPPQLVGCSAAIEADCKTLGIGSATACSLDNKNGALDTQAGASHVVFDKSCCSGATCGQALHGSIAGRVHNGAFPPSGNDENTAPLDVIPSAPSLAELKEEAWANSVSSLETGISPTYQRHLNCNPSLLKGVAPQWLNRAVVAALLAALLGLIPQVRQLLTAPGNFVFESMEKLGEAGPVMSLLSVGALFVSDGVPRPSAIGYAPLAGVLVGRLIALPICCISLWQLIRRLVPFFPSDRAFMLVLFLESVTPSAYNLVTMCVLQGRGAKELAAALFYQNIGAIFTMTTWVTVIMYIIT